MILTVITVITLIGMLVTNYLANALPIGGNTTGDISEKYTTLFTPAGFTFSIWGLIYLLLIIFVVMLLTKENILSTNRIIILILFNVVNILNIFWLLSWHNNQILLSTLVIISMLVSLLVILNLLSKSDTFSFVTFSIYAGWISVATIANIAILITKYDIGFFMNYERLWFSFIIGVSLFIAAYMLIKEKNIAYSSVFLWAYLGIIAKFL
ncbi:MAG: tryptophan-rich sensory protein [Candidatus Izemoplasmataceae bacterium]